MRKPIFESEEEFDRIFEDCNIFNPNNDFTEKIYTLEYLKKQFKQKGYIRLSLIEETNEMYSRFMRESEFKNALPLIEKQHEAIQYLKKQLEEK